MLSVIRQTCHGGEARGGQFHDRLALLLKKFHYKAWGLLIDRLHQPTLWTYLFDESKPKLNMANDDQTISDYWEVAYRKLKLLFRYIA